MTFTNDPALVEGFKREVAPLGEFATRFPNVTDLMISQAIGDAFARAQLDGFMGRNELDEGDILPDLTPREASLVLLYAGVRQLEIAIQNMNSRSLYEAGPVKYETEKAASVLTELLKGARARLLQAGVGMREGAAGTPVFTYDSYVLRNPGMP